MQPYNSPERLGTDQGGSVGKLIPYIQRGQIAGKINTTDLFIPCDLSFVENIVITPIAITNSDNQTALFTTVKGWEFDSLTTFLALSDIDDWATSTVYEVGTVVDGNADDSEAHICVTAHTASAAIATDEALGYWQTIDTETFIQMSHIAAGANEVTNFNFILFGYR
jgi:hypothetical protein